MKTPSGPKATGGGSGGGAVTLISCRGAVVVSGTIDVGGGGGAAGFDICFIHPKGNEELPIGGEGVLIELVQAPAEVVAAFSALAGTPS